ncbi:MAG: chalcone isomerase family protein [Pseudomonadota bacterium]
MCIFIFSPSWAAKNEVLSPLPSIVKENWNDFELVGQTTLRRFGFHVYDSSFWMVDKQNSIEQLDSATCALSITYARKIRTEQLLSSTKKEWLRLGFADQYPLDAWLLMLSNIWTDVDKGDQLVVVSDANGTSSFYNKDKRLGVIDDPQFGNAFLSIWLNENARFQKNRRELLGE